MSGNGYDEQEGFLTRWSRRKAQALRGEVPPDYMIRYMERRDRELRKAANE